MSGPLLELDNVGRRFELGEVAVDALRDVSLSIAQGEIVLETERGADVTGEVHRLPGIRYVEPVYDLPCTMRHGPYQYRTSIMGLVRDAHLTRPQTLHGATIFIPSTGLVVNRRLADILHVRVADSVEVRPIRGDRTVRRSRIRAISDGFLGVTACADIRHTSRLAGESLAVSRIQFLSDGDAGNDRRRNRQLKDTPVVSMTLSRHDLIASFEETIVRNMLVFIVVLVGFSGIVFLGSLVNASLISLSERVREVARLCGRSDTRLCGSRLGRLVDRAPDAGGSRRVRGRPGAHRRVGGAARSHPAPGSGGNHHAGHRPTGSDHGGSRANRSQG